MPLVLIVFNVPRALSEEGNSWKPLEKLPAPPWSIISPLRLLGAAMSLQCSVVSYVVLCYAVLCCVIMCCVLDNWEK